MSEYEMLLQSVEGYTRSGALAGGGLGRQPHAKTTLKVMYLSRPTIARHSLEFITNEIAAARKRPCTKSPSAQQRLSIYVGLTVFVD